MRRYITLLIAALIGSAMMMGLALPAHAQDEGDYSDINNGYYADSAGHGGRGERPYLAYSYAPKYKHDYQDEKVGYNDYKPPYHAYGYGYKKRHSYPKSRRTCVYGPLREKKICDWEPRSCWKERECYYVYGKKYCRYYTKCKGGERRCYWVKKNYGEGSSCNSDY